MKPILILQYSQDDSLEEYGEIINIDHIPSTSDLRTFAAEIDDEEYVLISTSIKAVKVYKYGIDRMIQYADMSKAAMLYSDYRINKNGEVKDNPLLDYQEGSLRDDFDFGSLLLYRSDIFKEIVNSIVGEREFAALYKLRLEASRLGKIFHIREFLYEIEETDLRKSGEKQFDYVDPKNRDLQIEMEDVCTEHLRNIGAYLSRSNTTLDLDAVDFEYEMSVVIPVKNRVKTIGNAIQSALNQETDFPYNVIVVDNHSTDGTSEVIRNLCLKDDKLIHIIPDSTDLGIGGCWNEAINDERCGKIAVQLDSDDLYIDNNVLQKIIEEFYMEECAMLIGSYKMVDFELNEIAPGLIDHREWTDENGHNNALRINGLGAPRAFYTPIIRQIPFPNVSYGEDYAIALRLSTDFRLARIYEPLYLCRRWNGNSDSSLDINKLNTYNAYKDSLRTLEIIRRKNILNDAQ